MRLSELRIENFRSCDDLSISFDDYTCLVGQNGAGKSTILSALNVLFRNQAGSPTPVLQLTEEDFCRRDTTKPITITATFNDLSNDEQIDFKAYFRQGQLIVSARATWDQTNQRADVKQYGARMVMRDFAPWFELLASGAKAQELKDAYSAILSKHPELGRATSKDAMEAALRAFEESNPTLCEPIESEDQFYGFSRGENRLRKYFQYVFIPAVKEAQSEQSESKTSALGELLQRTIRSKVDFEAPIRALKEETDKKYKDLLNEQQGALTDVTSALEDRLQKWAHPEARLRLEWQFDSDKSVNLSNPIAKALMGEGSFLGELSRLGHGLQRSFIVALLQELANNDAGGGPKLLLGFEEPELYQHPPQAQHLASLLLTLSKENAQVIVATHSPYFVSGWTFESVRLLRRTPHVGTSTCTSLTMDKVSTAIAQSLGKPAASPNATMAAIEQLLQPSQRELVFCGLPVLVEGLEDIAYIGTHMKLRGTWDAFRATGGHFIVGEGKTNLSRLSAIANELRIPAFVVFDGDLNKTKIEDIESNRRDNECLLKLSGMKEADPLSKIGVEGTTITMWPINIGESVRAEFGGENWDDAEAENKKALNLDGVRRKNGILISATLNTLWERGKRSEKLDGLCARILQRPDLPPLVV